MRVEFRENVRALLSLGTKQLVRIIPSLPECLIEFCKVTLTFESVDEIL